MGWGKITFISILAMAGAIATLYIFVPDAHQQACDYFTGDVVYSMVTGDTILAEIMKYPFAICTSLGLDGG